MKNVFISLFFSSFFLSCHKGNVIADQKGCDIKQVYADNAKKVTIAKGVWGTVSNIEGDCMPTIPACNSCCRHCPVQRTVKIFQYTLIKDGVRTDPYKNFFDSFNTRLVAQVDTDDNGFFQIGLPEGHYSIVIVENGKLYANEGDAQGGLNPVILTSVIQNLNLVMTYKAFF